MARKISNAKTGVKTSRARGSAAKTRRIDTILTEIVRNGVIAVTEEMKTNLMRTAYNMIIYEALDFTTGLFTAEGDTVSIGIGLPSFIRGMSNTVKSELAARGVSTSRLATEGYGEEDPVGDNSTDAGRAENRRVVLQVTNK